MVSQYTAALVVALTAHCCGLAPDLNLVGMLPLEQSIAGALEIVDQSHMHVYMGITFFPKLCF